MFTVIDYRLQARGTYIFCWPAGIYLLQDIHSVELGICPMQLFIFDHVTFIQFKICCCVQIFVKIQWFFFAEIWRYKDFQNGGRLPSWNCFTIIRDHPRSLCCWLQLPVKFHVNLIHTSEDIAIWIFRIFGLEVPIQAPKMGVLGDFYHQGTFLPLA